MGGFAISEAHKVETRTDELKEALDQLERTVFIKSEEGQVLRKDVKRITSVLDEMITDFNYYKERVVEIHYLISYITSKLMEGRKAIQDTGKAWRKGELTNDLLDFLNFTLPCGEDCPIEYGFFHGCLMKEDREHITLDISVPLVNRSLIRVKADTFDVMAKAANLTRRLKYTGPTMATLSIEEDCVYETHQRTAERLTMATSQKCTNSSSFKHDESHYQRENCRASRPGDKKDFIEVKIFNNFYHIYCPGSVYFIGKRQVKCPDKVFTLPLSLSFTLNEVEYKGSVLKIVYKENEDPYLTEHINYHLTPNINWSNLTSEIEADWKINEERIEDEAKRISVFKFKDEEGLSWTTIGLLILTGIMLIFIATACGFFYMKRKTKRTPVQKTPEEVPLSATLNHHIIIQ